MRTGAAGASPEMWTSVPYQTVGRCGRTNRRLLSYGLRSRGFRGGRPGHGSGVVAEGYGPVRTGGKNAETGQRILPAVFRGMAHLENEPVDLARGLQFVHSPLRKQTAQHAVVAFEQFRKEHGMSRLLDDESPQLGNDEPLVRLQVLRYDKTQHDSESRFNPASKLPFFREKTKYSLPNSQEGPNGGAGTAAGNGRTEGRVPRRQKRPTDDRQPAAAADLQFSRPERSARIRPRATARIVRSTELRAPSLAKRCLR